jgi:hypothetical protein
MTSLPLLVVYVSMSYLDYEHGTMTSVGPLWNHLGSLAARYDVSGVGKDRDAPTALPPPRPTQGFTGIAKRVELSRLAERLSDT